MAELPNKAQAINLFWNGFEWAGYDVNSVPIDAAFPYITFDVATDNLGNDISLSGSLWDYSTSWERITLKAEEIAEKLYNMPPIKIKSGYLWIKRGSPFAQRMSDPNDDMIRRIYINITVEYLTEF